jgi:hypothetical protein
MKHLVIFFLFFNTTYSQLLGYIPLKTYHLNRDENTLKDFHSTEGGNEGFVFIIRKVKNIDFREVNIGIIRNSYGDLSFLVQYGIGKKTKDFKISLNLGMATNYKGFYKFDNSAEKMPKILQNLNILPTGVLVISYDKYIIKPTILINPAYINYGVTMKL